MSVLLLRCAGPLQSWGTRSRFSERDTEREPSKSGIIGLLCAALGWGRDTPPDRLAALSAMLMGVRVDREGIVLRDFHTAQNVLRAGGGTQDTVISNRYYLQDAAFLVGLEGEDSLLATLDAALAAPVWPLYLGRRSCPPGAPVRLIAPLGHQSGVSLEEALSAYPSLAAPARGQTHLRFVWEKPFGQGVEKRQDTPLCFQSDARRFEVREVTQELRPLPAEVTTGKEAAPCI